jgi:SAM-dependent methyltransferase
MAVDRRDHWEHVYTEKAEHEVSWFQQEPTLSLKLIKAAGVARDARIVDVGGGASRLVDCLLDRGYSNVAVLDIADSALAQARRRLGARASGVDWIVADITRWQPAAPYDLWHDRAVFHFLVEPEQRAAYRRVLATAVKRGSSVIIGTFALDGPERCSGLPVARYSPATLAEELGDEFVLVEQASEDHSTPGGKIQHFQFSRLQRRA